VLAAGALLHGSDARRPGVGAIARLSARPLRRLQVHASGELASPWTDAAVTIREGGKVDGLGLDLYTTAMAERLVVGVGARVRRLQLAAPFDGEGAPSARQLVTVAGVDLVPWAPPGKVMRGEILDDELLWPSAFASALVVSYRHYEAVSEDALGPRLMLSERNAIDEISTVMRQVVGARGAFAVELRGGAGYDRAREVVQLRIGATFLVSATAGSRLSASFDSSNESAAGIVGRRHTGMVMFHVDL
jgi:hypothetical protein